MQKSDNQIKSQTTLDQNNNPTTLIKTQTNKISHSEVHINSLSKSLLLGRRNPAPHRHSSVKTKPTNLLGPSYQLSSHGKYDSDHLDHKILPKSNTSSYENSPHNLSPNLNLKLTHGNSYTQNYSSLGDHLPPHHHSTSNHHHQPLNCPLPLNTYLLQKNNRNIDENYTTHYNQYKSDNFREQDFENGQIQVNETNHNGLSSALKTSNLLGLNSSQEINTIVKDSLRIGDGNHTSSSEIQQNILSDDSLDSEHWRGRVLNLLRLQPGSVKVNFLFNFLQKKQGKNHVCFEAIYFRVNPAHRALVPKVTPYRYLCPGKYPVYLGNKPSLFL